MIGRVISHYRVVEQIGAGGMGVVYKAEDTRLGRHLALKFLPAEASQDRIALERFQREARAASSFNHPAICTIYDIGEFEGRQFIAMELLDGQPLDQFIAGKPLPINRVIDLGVQIADALDAAHAQGIMHRDIKPANIFITTRGSAKVLDFGLAKLAPTSRDTFGGAGGAAPTVAESLLTTGGLAIGTVAYMSPEQARGEDLDQRSDLFSFGVVLHEMATGKQAFQGNTTAVVFDAILNRMPPPVASLNPEVPPELERIIDKAIEKDRTLRYQSAADMRSDLQRLKRDRDSGRGVMASGATNVAGQAGTSSGVRPVTGAWPSPPTPATPQTPAAATPAAAGEPPHVPGMSSTAVNPAAAAAAAAAASSAAKPATPAKPGAKKGSNTGLIAGSAVLLGVLALGGFYAWRQHQAQQAADQAVADAAAVAQANQAAADKAVADAAAAAAAATATQPPVLDGAAPGAPDGTAPAAPGTPAAAPAAEKPAPAAKPASKKDAAAAGKKGAAKADASAPPVPRPAAPAVKPAVAELDPVAQAVDTAGTQLNDGQYDQAVSTLQGALAQKPDSRSAPDAYLMIATAYERQRRVESAITAFTEVKNRYPTNPASAEALVHLATLVQQTKDPNRNKTAADYLTQVATNFANTAFGPQALTQRANIEERENMKVTDPTLGKTVPAALVSYRQLVERYPTAASSELGYWKLASFYEDQKRYDLAADALSQLGTRFPSTRFDAWWEAAELYDKKVKDKAKAAEAYGKVPSSSKHYKDAQKKAQ
jgi:outer membrane protein assembly factor BamD (BamD/ComL family)/predicted Ser/Thr protein kinase